MSIEFSATDTIDLEAIESTFLTYLGRYLFETEGKLSDELDDYITNNIVKLRDIVNLSSGILSGKMRIPFDFIMGDLCYRLSQCAFSDDIEANNSKVESYVNKSKTHFFYSFYKLYQRYGQRDNTKELFYKMGTILNRIRLISDVAFDNLLYGLYGAYSSNHSTVYVNWEGIDEAVELDIKVEVGENDLEYIFDFLNERFPQDDRDYDF